MIAMEEQLMFALEEARTVEVGTPSKGLGVSMGVTRISPRSSCPGGVLLYTIHTFLLSCLPRSHDYI